MYVFQCKRFSNIHDVLTDGCGVWKGTGTKTFYATKGNDGSVEIVVDPHGTIQESYKIERRFYTHARYKDVKRNFVLIKGKVQSVLFLKTFTVDCHPAS